ncbi:basic proline-rich protein-like [Cygnus olor]|uniref:basic proline-rich protein-like n=1 Tax=Cygnus olor TaxID=8869 RepID=UPI001ADE4EDA|nr:basic proline-rich protein-like [Cygnus olor]
MVARLGSARRCPGCKPLPGPAPPGRGAELWGGDWGVGLPPPGSRRPLLALSSPRHALGARPGAAGAEQSPRETPPRAGGEQSPGTPAPRHPRVREPGESGPPAPYPRAAGPAGPALWGLRTPGSANPGSSGPPSPRPGAAGPMGHRGLRTPGLQAQSTWSPQVHKTRRLGASQPHAPELQDPWDPYPRTTRPHVCKPRRLRTPRLTSPGAPETLSHPQALSPGTSAPPGSLGQGIWDLAHPQPGITGLPSLQGSGPPNPYAQGPQDPQSYRTHGTHILGLQDPELHKTRRLGTASPVPHNCRTHAPHAQGARDPPAPGLRAAIRMPTRVQELGSSTPGSAWGWSQRGAGASAPGNAFQALLRRVWHSQGGQPPAPRLPPAQHPALLSSWGLTPPPPCPRGTRGVLARDGGCGQCCRGHTEESRPWHQGAPLLTWDLVTCLATRVPQETPSRPDPAHGAQHAGCWQERGQQEKGHSRRSTAPRRGWHPHSASTGADQPGPAASAGTRPDPCVDSERHRGRRTSPRALLVAHCRQCPPAPTPPGRLRQRQAQRQERGCCSGCPLPGRSRPAPSAGRSPGPAPPAGLGPGPGAEECGRQQAAKAQIFRQQHIWSSELQLRERG